MKSLSILQFQEDDLRQRYVELEEGLPDLPSELQEIRLKRRLWIGRYARERAKKTMQTAGECSSMTS
jgi:hypothetical protein